MSPTNIKAWFCLNQDRDNFKPSNISDGDLTFCHKKLLDEDILNSIERKFAGNEPVKMLMYGDWGAGKTHTINHIAWWLENHKNDYPATTVSIELGDITKTTRFDAIVRPFVEKIGLDTLNALVHKYLPLPGGDVRKKLMTAGVPEHIADAFSKFLTSSPGTTPTQMVLYAFDYLKGAKLPSTATSMGFGPQLSDSKDFYYVLYAIGTMHLAVHDHRIIFIADEAAKLEAVDNDDATRAHWVSVNKEIFDDRNNTFGFIYTISGRRKSIPQALLEDQLQNRLGNNIFEIPNLQSTEVESFIRNLMESFVDRDQVEQLVKDGEIDKSIYSWTSYPFEAAAQAEFIDYFNRSLGEAKPRDICTRLNDVAFYALKRSKRLIDSECIKSAKM